MKRILFSALLLVSALMANAFDNRYQIVAKIENGVEKPYQGVITLTGSQNYRGLVEYNHLTIYISDIINYSWSIMRKDILDEQTVRLTDYGNKSLTYKQLNDSLFVFDLPLFYGSKQGTVKYKAVIEGEPQEAAAAAAKQAKAQDALHGLFGSGSGTNTAGSGSAATSNYVRGGSGKSNGASWSVAGRGLMGSLSKPSYNSNSEGTVVVSIRVDSNGNVVSATKGAGTNTSDQALIQAACDAAKKAKFTGGDGVAVGTITYVFKLS